MEAAFHHLARIDQVVMHSGHHTRLEAACPMRFLQLAAKMRLVVGDRRKCEEAILEVTRQKRTVLQIVARVSLGVEQPLYSLDDLVTVDQEHLQKTDMRPKRHLARTFACHNASPP